MNPKVVEDLAKLIYAQWEEAAKLCWDECVNPLYQFAARHMAEKFLEQHEDEYYIAIQQAIDVMGPGLPVVDAPSCCGCAYEWNHAIQVLKDVIKP